MLLFNLHMFWGNTLLYGSLYLYIYGLCVGSVEIKNIFIYHNSCFYVELL